jgi:hypothetical protein
VIDMVKGNHHTLPTTATFPIVSRSLVRIIRFTGNR